MDTAPTAFRQASGDRHQNGDIRARADQLDQFALEARNGLPAISVIEGTEYAAAAAGIPGARLPDVRSYARHSLSGHFIHSKLHPVRPEHTRLGQRYIIYVRGPERLTKGPARRVQSSEQGIDSLIKPAQDPFHETDSIFLSTHHHSS